MTMSLAPSLTILVGWTDGDVCIGEGLIPGAFPNLSVVALMGEAQKLGEALESLRGGG
jgi:hypothetical protein